MKKPDIQCVDEQILKIKQTREIETFLNSLKNMVSILNEKILYITSNEIDHQDKYGEINKTRDILSKNLQTIFPNILSEKKKNRYVSYERPFSSNNSYINNYNNDKNYKSLSANYHKTATSGIPSLWVSNFSENISQEDLYELFKPLDSRLTLELVSYRNKYAFINFRDNNAAEEANNRVWNINGEILDTNVRYPKSKN